MIGYLYSILAGWMWIGVKHYWLPVLLSWCYASEIMNIIHDPKRPLQQQGSYG